MKPRRSAVLFQTVVAPVGVWKRLTPLDAPKIQKSLPFQPFWASQGAFGMVGS